MKTRTIVVQRDEVGRPVASLLKHHLHISWSQARRLVQQNRVRQGPGRCRDAPSCARLGQKLRVRLDERPPKPAAPKSAPKPTGPQPVIRHADAHIVVVDKPAGLTTVRHAHETAEFGARGRRYLPPTLVDMLPGLLAAKVRKKGKHGRQGGDRAVHRLDQETSGLVVLARTPQAERSFGQQFRAHSVERRYLALVRGRAKDERIESYLVPDRGDGRRGSSSDRSNGQRAVTHVRLVEDLGDYSLVECRLETGRTHQVRIHLGERGTPLCGETIYDRPVNAKPLLD